MFRPFGGRLVAIFFVIIGAMALAIGAYNVGLSAGLATAGGATRAAAPLYWAYGPAGGFPWFFFPIGFFLFIFLLFWIVRAAAWGARGGHPGPNRWGDGASPRFEEWHRRAHEQSPGATPPRPDDAAGRDDREAPR
jgi:hypothetical protein